MCSQPGWVPMEVDGISWLRSLEAWKDMFSEREECAVGTGQTLGKSCSVETHESPEGAHCGVRTIREEKSDGSAESVPDLCLLKGNRLEEKLSLARHPH